MGEGSACGLPRAQSISLGLLTRTRCDLERARVAIGTNAPAFTDLQQMIAATQPETLIVCTRDDTHADIIVAALEAGVDVITEKPMTTTAEMCRRILEAERRTGRRVDVTFNYRYAPTARRIKELLLSGVIGEIASVDFHWYLDTQPRRRLFPPLACLCEKFGQPLRPQGDPSFRPAELVSRSPIRKRCSRAATCAITAATGPFRGPRCKICAHAERLRLLLRHRQRSLARDALRGAVARGRLFPRRLRVSRGHRHLRHDERGDPLRERRAGLLFAQHLHADRGLSPRLQRHAAAASRSANTRQQAWEMPDEDEILRAAQFRAGRTHPRAASGAAAISAATRPCRTCCSSPASTDPLGQRAGARAGAVSVVTGVAALQSVRTGEPVQVKTRCLSRRQLRRV